MKLWKKMMLSIAGVGILACGAFLLPMFINRYDDGEDINKIKYVDSKNIDVFKYDSKQYVEERFSLLSKIYNGSKPYIIQIPFEPDEKQISEIQKNAESELKKWFEEGIGYDILSLGLNVEERFDLKDLKLYSIYSDFSTDNNEKITYLELMLSPLVDPESVIKLYMDSSDYKIYLISLEGAYIPKYVIENKFNMQDFIMTNMTMDQYDMLYTVKEKISEYYEIDDINMQVSVDGKVDDRFMCLINSSVIWSASAEINEEGEQIIYVGIRGFENDFFDMDKTSVTYSENNELKY